MTQERKKILMVTTSNRMAGTEKNILDILRFIDRRKYYPRLVIFKDEENGELDQKALALGVEVDQLKINSKWQFLKVLELLKIIRSFQPDILQSFLFFDNQACRILGRITRIEYIISGQQNAETRMSKIRIFTDKMTINLCHAIISNTKAGEVFYKKNNYKFKGKIYIGQNGIDIDSLKLFQAHHLDRNNEMVFGVFSQKEILRIVSVGYLTEQKGTTFLIKALEILRNQNQQFKCFIIGQGVLEEDLKKEVKERKLDQHVFFLGYISESFKYFKLRFIYSTFIMGRITECNLRSDGKRSARYFFQGRWSTRDYKRQRDWTSGGS